MTGVSRYQWYNFVTKEVQVLCEGVLSKPAVATSTGSAHLALLLDPPGLGLTLGLKALLVAVVLLVVIVLLFLATPEMRKMKRTQGCPRCKDVNLDTDRYNCLGNT